MKKITLLVATILLLSACGTSKQDARDVGKSEITADSILDNQMMTDAITTKNESDCDAIMDDSKKEECKSSVTSLIIIDKAVASTDKSLCGKIKLNRYKENCEKKVEEKLNYINADAKRKESEKAAIEKGDASLCDEIEDDNIKGACQFNVLANMAIQRNDPSLCDEIEYESRSQECKKNFTKK